MVHAIMLTSRYLISDTRVTIGELPLTFVMLCGSHGILKAKKHSLFREIYVKVLLLSHAICNNFVGTIAFYP